MAATCSGVRTSVVVIRNTIIALRITCQAPYVHVHRDTCTRGGALLFCKYFRAGLAIRYACSA
jgi:hypothetical protein